MECQDVRPRPARPPQPATPQEQTVHKIRKLHDEAYLYIEQGLTCDEKEQREQAVTLYTKGLRCIDQALTLPLGNAGTEQANVDKMVAKMQHSRSQIQGRVETLIKTDAGVAYAVDNPPPSYEIATTPTSSEFDMLMEESLMLDRVADQGEIPMGASAQELFKINDGVQIYFITPEGYVSAPSYPASLAIYRFSDQVCGASNGTVTPPAFLKIGDWTYPLVPGHSPVLHANWGSYVFPDTNSDAGKKFLETMKQI